MQGRSGTIQKIVPVTIAVFLLLLVVWFFLDLTIFSKKNHAVFAQFDAAQVATRANNQCKDDTSNRCFKNFFANFAKLNKFEKTKLVLDELIKINKSKSHCHGIAHEISIAEVAKDPQNWLNVFSYVPGDECSAGFYHGIIEGKFQTDPNLVVDAGLIDTICAEQLADIKNSGNRCSHAFGHVLMVQMEGRVGKSIQECQAIDNDIKSSCLQGVFMEHIQKDNLEEHGISVRENWNQKFVDVEKKSCERYADQEQIECWRSLGPAIIKSSNSGYIEAVGECNGASSDLSRRACTREVLGKLLVDEFASNDEPEEDYCRVFKGKDEYGICLKDIINYAMLTSIEFKDKMEDYCNRVLSEERKNCLKTVKSFTVVP